MSKVYNVSVVGIAEQLKFSFEKVKLGKDIKIKD